MADDLYGILGVSKGCSDGDLKKAYRRLARENHPDVNKSAGAEAKFKEIQRAYSILSNPQKRQQYDQFGVADDSAGGAGGAGFDGFSDAFEDIFDSFFGGSRGRSRQGGRQKTAGDDLRYDLEMDLEEINTGIEREIEIYYVASADSTTCTQCGGAGQVQTVQKTLLGSFSQIMTCPQCNGVGRRVKDIKKKKKKINVKIPPGVTNGTRLRVSGEGNISFDGGPAGDLYVIIAEKRHKYFVRKEEHIYMELEIPYTYAILGTEVNIPTLDGTAKLKIPSGVQAESVLRLRGKGLSRFQSYGKGDLNVVIKIEIPSRISNDERKIVESLATIRQDKSKLDNILKYVKQLF